MVLFKKKKKIVIHPILVAPVTNAKPIRVEALDQRLKDKLEYADVDQLKNDEFLIEDMLKVLERKVEQDKERTLKEKEKQSKPIPKEVPTNQGEILLKDRDYRQALYSPYEVANPIKGTEKDIMVWHFSERFLPIMYASMGVLLLFFIIVVLSSFGVV